MSALVDALLSELDDAALDRLAERLRPRLLSTEGDRWLRGAEAIAAYIDAPRSRVYSLASAGRLPVEHDGSNLLARTSVLDGWIRDGGSLRP